MVHLLVLRPQWKLKKELYSCLLLLFSHLQLDNFFNVRSYTGLSLDIATENGIMFNAHSY